MKKYILFGMMSVFWLSSLAVEGEITKVSDEPMLTWETIISPRFDRNKFENGPGITKEELGGLSFVMKILAMKYFKEIDSDGDGFIGSAEIHTFSEKDAESKRNKMNTKWFSIDKNKDGIITREEAKESSESRYFSRLDQNQDGLVTPTEMLKEYNTTLLSMLGLSVIRPAVRTGIDVR